jgi:YD repeat-containing protein
MKHPYLLTGFLFLGLAVHFTGRAQQAYSFGYDANGNRTSRTIYISGLKSTSRADSAQNQEYKEVTGDLEIILYPNPTKGALTVVLKSPDEQQPSAISVYDYNGRLLQVYDNLQETNTIDLSGLPRATYILRIISGTRKSEWKVVKE